MRFLENLFIKIFSLVILILSILVILIGLDFVDLDIFDKIFKGVECYVK